MKTDIEIKIKKIRKQLRAHTLSEEKKTLLRKELADLKEIPIIKE